jgi:hypothetical protein
LLLALADGLATLDQLKDALALYRAQRQPLGRLALQHRMLTTLQVYKVLDDQAENGGLFGEVAVRLGFLDKAKFCDLIMLQNRSTPAFYEFLEQQHIITAEQAIELRDKITGNVCTVPRTAAC